MPKKKRQKKAVGMRSNELSLVDAGANLQDGFPFSKSKEKGLIMDEKLFKTVLETTGGDDEKAFTAIFDKSKVDISDEGKQALIGVHRLVKGYQEHIPKEMIAEVSKALGFQAEEPKKPEATKKSEVPPVEKPKKKKDEKGDEVDDKVKAKIDAVEKKYSKELEGRDGKIEELQKALKVEQDARRMAGWTQRVEKNLAGYPEKTEVLAKQLFDMTPELAESHFKVLQSTADNFAKSAITNSLGSSIAPSLGSGYEKIKKSAEAIRKEDSKLSLREAEEIALERNPELYDEYCESMEGGQ